MESLGDDTDVSLLPLNQYKNKVTEQYRINILREVETGIISDLIRQLRWQYDQLAHITSDHPGGLVRVAIEPPLQHVPAAKVVLHFGLEVGELPSPSGVEMV